MPIKKTALALTTLAILASAPAFAVTQFSTLSGGVTTDERSEIDSTQRANYSLKLAFAKPSGEYLTDVQVTVRDASGNTVVSQTSPGPYFLIALPAGTYDVTAQVEGQTRTQKVTIKGGAQKSYTMRFNVA